MSQSTPSSERTLPLHQRYDAVVVGTGFGGAVTACRLAQAGFRTLVLERGRRYGRQDFPPLPSASVLAPDVSRYAWKHDQGLWDVKDLGELVGVHAAGYGGGSLVYANVHLRPPRELFDDRWPAALRTGSALEEYYDLAASMLNVAPIGERNEPSLAKTTSLQRAATTLSRGPDFFYPPLAVNYVEVQDNGFGRAQEACRDCGQCCNGCPYGAKNTLDHNYLAVAEQHGAEVRTLCEVVQLEEQDDGWRLELHDHVLQGPTEPVLAPYLFMCAGTFSSVQMLMQAKAKPERRAFQSRLGIGFYPNADALGVVFDTKQAHEPTKGPVITSALMHWDPQRNDFFMIQDGGYAPQLERMVGTLRAPLWLGRNRLTNPGVSEGAPGSRSAVGGSSLPSILDALLDAGAEGAVRRAIPDALTAAWPNVRSELKKPTLLDEVVTNVIVSIVRRFVSERAPLRWFRSGGRVQRGAGALIHFMVRQLSPTPDTGDAALRALLTAAGLERADVATKVFGYHAGQPERRAVLLAMGTDRTSGVLQREPGTNKLIADLDLHHMLPTYQAEESLMTELALDFGGELRVNPAWSFLGKPITVHAQGGCRMSDDPALGVTDHLGRVHGHERLYVLDGSILPTSVGVNPSASITALAERGVLAFIRSFAGKQSWPHDDSAGAKEYALHRERALRWANKAEHRGWSIRPPSRAQSSNTPLPVRGTGVEFSERMAGSLSARPAGFFASAAAGAADYDERYRVAEAAGKLDTHVQLDLTLRCADVMRFMQDMYHPMTVKGTVRLTTRAEGTRTFDATGVATLFAERRKPYGLRRKSLKHAQKQATGFEYRTERLDKAHPEQRFMRYALAFRDPGTGKHYQLRGYKRIRQDAGFDAWRDTSTLYVQLRQVEQDAELSTAMNERTGQVQRVGALHVELTEFLFEQLKNLRAIDTLDDAETSGPQDSARATWAISTFSAFFFGSLQRVYSPAVGTALNTFFSAAHSDVRFNDHARQRR